MRVNADLLRQRAKEIRDARVWEVLRDNLVDFEAYLAAVGDLIREQG